MLILIHVLIAISGLAAGTYAALRPARSTIGVTYRLTALTLLSGTVLVVATHAAVLQTCLSGLLYTAVIAAQLAVAHSRLQKQRAD